MVNDLSGRTTEIGPCQCKSEFQDVRYGKGNRVHNRRHAAGSPTKITGYGCSVCGRGVRRPPGSRCDSPDYEAIALKMGVYYA